MSETHGLTRYNATGLLFSKHGTRLETTEEVYLASEVDLLLASKDAQIAALRATANANATAAVIRDEELGNALAELETLRHARDWQPIATAPKDEQELLLCDEDGVTTGRWFANGKGRCYWMNCYTKRINPTHWMPLPAAQEE